MTEIYGNAVAKVLEQMTPKCLDDVIRANRHLATVRLANDAEILALQAELASGPGDTIDDWRFIALVVEGGELQMMLLGDRQRDGNPWITSAVRGIDHVLGLVRTNSGSLYRLGVKGAGEPPPYHLTTVCAAFHQWGFGKALGVAEFTF